VTLSAPMHTSDADIIRFLDEHREWIVRSIDKVNRRAEARPALQYVDGERHLFFGRLLTLRVVPERGRESVAFYDDEILLYCHPDRTMQQRKKLLYQGYYQQFKPVLSSLINKWETRLTEEMSPLARLANPRKYTGLEITVRLMKTEWGSCTPAKHRMTYNLDLARLPLECIEYVVVHEYTHLDHCNHSDAFWALCDRRLAAVGLADSKQQRARIKALTR